MCLLFFVYLLDNLTMAIRIDSLRLDAPKIDPKTGFLTADAFVTRTGVFQYRHADGTVTNELRHPDDVLKNDSLESLKRKPVVNEHPQTGRVDSKNASLLQVGFTGDTVDTKDLFVRAPITITDAGMVATIMDAENPKRELSCGYDATIIEESGVFNCPGHPDDGKRYDHRQTEIDYNHVAVVGRGRAGEAVRLRVDSQAAVLNDFQNVCYFETNDNDSKKDQEKMPVKIKLDTKQAG